MELIGQLRANKLGNVLIFMGENKLKMFKSIHINFKIILI